jgi:2-methylcitrate dehydratase PrpD
MLAEFAAGLRFEDLPERTRAHCKNLVLDALASVLAGHQGEETGPVRALALALDYGSARKLMALLRAAPRARAVAAAE